MAVVTIIARKVRANSPGRWAPDFWFVGINETRPNQKNTRITVDGPVIFEGNFTLDLGPSPDDRAALMAHHYAMGIISKERLRRIVDFGGS